MKKYQVISSITLTVEAGSEVIVSDSQHKLAEGYLKPIDGTISTEPTLGFMMEDDLFEQVTKKKGK